MNPENENNEEIRRADFASKKGEVVLRPHEYDGIQEFDQKLPNWWLITFYGAIIFYLIYWFVYYQAGMFQTDQDAVTAAVSEVHAEKQRVLAETLANLNDEILVQEWAADASIVANGEAFYNELCIACHGPNLDAPNNLGLSLVDGTWKYGDRPMDIFKLINEGTPADSEGMAPTGARMAPWGANNSPIKIAEVAAFLISKNPDDFKEFAKP